MLMSKIKERGIYLYIETGSSIIFLIFQNCQHFLNILVIVLCTCELLSIG